MVKTTHKLINGDARDLSFIPDESVHLVITSPPYWNLKRYNENPSQMGHIQDYETFLGELSRRIETVMRTERFDHLVLVILRQVLGGQ